MAKNTGPVEAAPAPSFPTRTVLGILVLVLAVLIAAYVLFQQSMRVAETPTVDTPVEGTYEHPALSEQERSALLPPDATDMTAEAHAVLVAEVAVNGNEIAIGPYCQLYPAVLSARRGDEVVVTNYNDFNQQIVFFRTGESYLVPGRSRVSFTVDFETAGTHGYGCTSNPLAVGTLLVTE